MHIRILGISNQPTNNKPVVPHISYSDMDRYGLDYCEDMTFDWDECKEIIEDMFPDETGLVFDDAEHSFLLSQQNNADHMLERIKSRISNATTSDFFKYRESIIGDLKYSGNHDLFWLNGIEYPLAIYGMLYKAVGSKFYVYAMADAHI